MIVALVVVCDSCASISTINRPLPSHVSNVPKLSFKLLTVKGKNDKSTKELLR